MEDAYLDGIPLRLAEGAALSASVSLSPQFGGRLGPGDLSQQDLSSYARRQQSDWSGGRGLEFAHGATNRFRDAVAETRFQGMIALPPQPVRVIEAGVPQWLPSQTSSLGTKRVNALWIDPGTRQNTTKTINVLWAGSGTSTTQAASAQWADAGRTSAIRNSRAEWATQGTESQVDVQAAWAAGGTQGVEGASAQWADPGRSIGAQNVQATWDSAGRSDTERNASAVWSNAGQSYNAGQQVKAQDTAANYEYSTVNGDYISTWLGDVANSFTTGATATVAKTLSMWMRVPSSSATVRIHICSDSSDTPGTSLGSGDVTVSATSFTQYTANVSVSLAANTKYWIRAQFISGTIQRHQIDNAGTLPGTGKHNASSGNWEAIGSSNNFRFQVSTLLLTRTRAAQIASISVNTTVTKVQVFLDSVTAFTGSPTLTLALYTNSGGGVPDTFITSGTFTPAVGWNSVNMSASLTAGVAYWVVLEASGTNGSGVDCRVNWAMDANGTYLSAGFLRVTSSVSGTGAFGGWGGATGNHYFKINDGYVSGHAYFDGSEITRVVTAQSFTPSANTTVTQVQLYLRRVTWAGSPTLRLRIRADSAGSPGSSDITSAAVAQPSATAGWQTITISASLTAGATYWLLLDCDAPLLGGGDAITIAWGGDAALGYAGAPKNLTVANQSSGAWTTGTADLYFRINSGYASGAPYFEHSEITRVRVAQSFTLAATTTISTVGLYLKRTTWTGSPTLTLRLQADSAGNPSGTDIATASIAQPGTSSALNTISITANNQPAGVYWLVVEADASASATGLMVEWARDNNAVYPGGSARTRVYQNQSLAAWVASGVDQFFRINTGYPSAPYFEPLEIARSQLAQSFTTAGAVTTTQVQLYARQVSTAGAPTLQLSICNDSAGSPGTAIATVTPTLGGTAGWNTINIGASLGAATLYWLVVNTDAAAQADAVSIEWTGDTSAPYTNGSCKRRSYAAQTWGAWAAATPDLFFRINTGNPSAPYFEPNQLVKTIAAQSFTPSFSFTLTQLQLQLQGLTWGGSPTLQLQICSDSAGAPGSAINTVSMAQPGGTRAWVTTSIAASLTSGSTYWIVLNADALTSSDSVGVRWYGSTTAGFPAGGASRRDFASQTFGAWTGQAYDLFFRTNTGYDAGYPYYDPASLTRDELAQSFTPAAGVTVSSVQVYLRAATWTGSPTLALSICSNSSGSPGSTLVSANVAQPAGTAGWVTVNIATSLTGGTLYWLVLTSTAPTTADNISIEWTGDNGAGYTGGSAKNRTYAGQALGSWTGQTPDLYFRINTGYAESAPYWLPETLTQTRPAQSFTTVGAVTMTQVQLLLRQALWTGSPTLTLKICSDSAGSPGSVLASATVAQPSASQTWNVITLAASLSATTLYWLVLVPNAPTTTDATNIEWFGDAGAGYADGSAKTRTDSDITAGAWAAATPDLCFRINAGYPSAPYFELAAVDRDSVAQSFTTPGSTVTLTQIQVRLSTATWTGSPTLTLKICSDSAGSPGSVLASATVAQPPTTATWVTVAVAASLSATTLYWIVIEADAPSSADTLTVNWHADLNAGYASGTCKTDTGGGWTAATGDVYFIVNTGYASGHPYFMPTVVSRQRQGQRFVTTGALTLTTLSFYARLVQWTGTGSATLRLFSDSAGAPNTQIASTTLTQATFASATLTPTWISVSIAASLGAATNYWVVIDADASDDATTVEIDWSADLNAGYSYSRYANLTDTTAFGAWTAQTATLFFMANSTLLSSVTLKPVEFKAKWYVGAGASVYRFNTGSGNFDLVYTLAANITDMAEIGGYIYAAAGDAVDIVRSTTGDSGSWSAVAGRAYTHLLRYDGYLNALKSTGGANAFAYTADGTTWDSIAQVANSEIMFTDMVGFRNGVMLLADKGLWDVQLFAPVQVADWSNQRNDDNGKGALVWLANNLLYIPIRNSLVAYDGARQIPTGLDVGGEYLPAGKQGRVSCMIGMGSWLIVSIDAGTAGRSAIYAFNGTGFHCLAEAQTTGKRIRSMGFEGVTGTNPRLWWWEDNEANYIEMPELTDNPYGFAGSRFQSSGYVQSARLMGETGNIVKDFSGLELLTSDCAAGAQEIDVYVRVDNGPAWGLAGTVNRSPRQRIDFVAPAVADKTVAAGSTTTTIIVASSNTADLAPARFVRIGSEVAQVQTVTNATTFTLVTPLAAVPTTGATIRGTTPAGREIEYQLVLRTTDPTKTPRVLDVMVIYQEQLLDKAIIPITVRCDSEMTLRTGAAYPYTETQLRDRLYEIARLVKPVPFVDWNGRVWNVKVRSISESGVTRRDDQLQNTRDVTSQFSLTLVEA